MNVYLENINKIKGMIIDLIKITLISNLLPIYFLLYVCKYYLFSICYIFIKRKL